MKLRQLPITASILLLSLSACFAQDVRTLKTKVADVLAYLPTEDNAQAERLFVDLSNLGEEGIRMVTDQVKPNGDPAGVPYRFAVSLLTHYATNPLQKALIEKVYLYELNAATNAEVKAYFMDNLKWIGSDVAVKPVAVYISDNTLFRQAIPTIQIIGTAGARQALLGALANPPAFAKARLIQALGELREPASLDLITKAVADGTPGVKKQALWSLALLADSKSAELLLNEAKGVGFKNDPSETTQALIEYVDNLRDTKITASLCKTILENTTALPQQHFRLAALEALAKDQPATAAKLLIKELNHFDAEYRKEVLKIAAPLTTSTTDLQAWEKEYKKATGEVQSQILFMMAQSNRNENFITSVLVPALSSGNSFVREVAAQQIAFSRNKKFTPALVDYLSVVTDDTEIEYAKGVVLQMVDKDNIGLISQKIATSNPRNKVALLQVVAERRATDAFDQVYAQTTASDPAVRAAAFAALPRVSSGKNAGTLITRLSTTTHADEVKTLQAAIISGTDARTLAQVNTAWPGQKIKLVPVLPYMNDQAALEKVKDVFAKGTDPEKQIAFDALQNWQNSDAIRSLVVISRDPALQQYHLPSMVAAIKQVSASYWTDDEKLLFLEELMSFPSDKPTRILIIRAAGNVRTFLSLVFVAGYLDDADLGAPASRAAMQLALPTADARPGMTGNFVRQTLMKIQERLIGEDSQYERIDVATYLGKLPYTKGFESIFNGKDLTGWHAVVENPMLRKKMTRDILDKKQKEADAKVSKSWSVKDGTIVFTGDGANLATNRPYGDFEMIVDWRISKDGDSGIYLRGSPQVQIWDIARVAEGAQVGSGGLYNNQKGTSKPLVVADNPVGEWNTFQIKITGDKVTVYLNGFLVTDNVVMENYWDKTLPLFSEEAIELQAHGTELAFRNVFVKETGSASLGLSDDEKLNGFQSLFNGKDLDLWTGNKTDYVVEDNAIAVYPAKESHGNLATVKSYSNFIMRFDFQLTPGANNGIGIHAPTEGDVAYIGKEIQILDDTAPVYATLEPYQYHGSVYGILAAKRGYLKPVGDWNSEEIEVKGDYIKVTLNGTVITEGDIKKATQTGTLDHKDHPGLKSHQGPVQFLGHGSTVRFRNVRIKEL